MTKKKNKERKTNQAVYLIKKFILSHYYIMQPRGRKTLAWNVLLNLVQQDMLIIKQTNKRTNNHQNKKGQSEPLLGKRSKI